MEPTSMTNEPCSNVVPSEYKSVQYQNTLVSFHRE